MSIDHLAGNMREVNGLNQRGGRLLSIIDLIRLGTIDVNLASSLVVAIHRGASMLCCALEGGVGKTTLLAALLGLLPASDRVITVDDGGVQVSLSRASPGSRTCLLVHEIGQGGWYGYAWGPPVLVLARAAGAVTRVAATIHADTMDQVVDQFRSFGGDIEDVARFDMVLFIARVAGDRAGSHRKRVVNQVKVRGPGGLFHDGFPGEHFDQAARELARAWLQDLEARDVVNLEAVAAAIQPVHARLREVLAR